MAYEAKIILDSISPDGIRLTTFEVTFPRIVLAEFNTHRMFSRNSASSRAIPVQKMIKKVIDDPFIPIYWGKNQKGMQAEQELDEHEQAHARGLWLQARDRAVGHAESLLFNGIHKQITNRLLEPFLWHTVIVTATEWDNFFHLRAHKDAQPEIQKIARMMKGLYDTNVPKRLEYGQWHLPLLQPNEFVVDRNSPEWNEPVGAECVIFDIEMAKKVSAGRCARVSYLTHDGRRDPQADVELCEKLAAAGHMSPLEHVARPVTRVDVEQKVENIPGVYGIDQLDLDPSTMFFGNLRGWTSYRQEIPFERDVLGSQ